VLINVKRKLVNMTQVSDVAPGPLVLIKEEKFGRNNLVYGKAPVKSERLSP
jgi:hypothetical protein